MTITEPLDRQAAPTSPRHTPVEIAPETFVIQDTQGEGAAPVAVHLNSMVIRGAEPIVVDTGVPTNRERFLHDLFSLVDPTEVRWVFLSHDDVDHYGNLDAVMDACPNATLLVNWYMWERMGCLPGIDPRRMRWVDDGDAFEANGRTYVAMRPPLFDSPTTRGLLDTATGVYWASDCFATTVPHGMVDVAEMDRDDWAAAMVMNAHALSPWVFDIDQRRFDDTVDRFASAGITTIASCHSPTIFGDSVDVATRILRDVPRAPQSQLPGQQLLDTIIEQIAAGAAS